MVPTIVAINKSLLNQSRSSSEGNWIAQHNVSVMVDLDFFIGDDALSKAWSSSTYNLTYPIKHGQVENRDANFRRHGTTHVVPVADGYVIGSDIESVPIDGKDVTLVVWQLMRERGKNIPPEDFF
ncbi:hypothetical protein KIW84_045051 [Lathyrus oleraceus]|uniref:Uncharacterized protein n=1 Tax=Pisum sativum TaxID=3888 RepID=A0A9D4XI18_PEA|nr:hypothetical protein KIW84_045051 [Pisum sativum]